MRIKKSDVWALIPARGGSKGVPRKNIKLLGGYPLIAYSIAICKMTPGISRAIVSTDDDEIAEIALKYGAEVPFRRPDEAASDVSTDYEFVKHALDWFGGNEGEVAEYLAHIRPTTPLRDPAIVEVALNRIKKDDRYTSLRSAHLAPESPYKWFLKNPNDTFRSVSGKIDNDTANNGRNQFPNVYIPDGYIDILKTQYILDKKKLHGKMMMAFESPFCTEVDTLDEFEYLEYHLEKKKSETYEFLKKNFEQEKK